MAAGSLLLFVSAIATLGAAARCVALRPCTTAIRRRLMQPPMPDPHRRAMTAPTGARPPWAGENFDWYAPVLGLLQLALWAGPCVAVLRLALLQLPLMPGLLGAGGRQ